MAWLLILVLREFSPLQAALRGLSGMLVHLFAIAVPAKLSEHALGMLPHPCSLSWPRYRLPGVESLWVEPAALFSALLLVFTNL